MFFSLALSLPCAFPLASAGFTFANVSQDLFLPVEEDISQPNSSTSTPSGVPLQSSTSSSTPSPSSSLISQPNSSTSTPSGVPEHRSTSSSTPSPSESTTSPKL